MAPVKKIRTKSQASDRNAPLNSSSLPHPALNLTSFFPSSLKKSGSNVTPSRTSSIATQ